MNGLLVFAVVPAHRLDPALLDEGEGLPPGLRAIAAGALAAVVGAAPEGGLKGRERSALLPWLLASQKVMERLLARAPVLPVALGTVIEDESRVRHLLEAGGAVLAGGLQEVGDSIEMSLSVTWQLDTVVARLLPGVSAELVRAAAEGGESERKALGALLAGLVAAERSRLRSRVIDRLRRATRDITVREPADPAGVVEMALLVDRAAEAELGAALESLDADGAGALTFRLVGPLPPYSFASVQVDLAPRARVAEARTMLGVPAGADAATVRAAYRRAARETHPDLVPMGGAGRDDAEPGGGSDTEATRFIALSEALRVLESEGAPVSLRRQETLPLD
ncbi:GvpL/GvpF family gas vesicle protein [Ancylobacter sp. IITR112]|uniref:GvpL/GvpF family gas vesicle protein n=1 Tax=Ancylobacter sp. IITR112 TaxID=3138073 RepID=UPI00352B5569